MYAPHRAIDRAAFDVAARYLAIYEQVEDRYPTTLDADDLRDLRYRVAYAVEHGIPIVVTPREIVALLRIADPPGVPIEDLVNNLLTNIAPVPPKVPPTALPHLAAGDAALARGDYGAAADAIDLARGEIRRGGA